MEQQQAEERSLPVVEKPWVPLVDGDAVLKRTKAILDWGPRPSGSEAIKNVRLEIKGQLEEIGIPLADVKEQSFTIDTEPRVRLARVHALLGDNVAVRRDCEIVLGSHPASLAALRGLAEDSVWSGDASAATDLFLWVLRAGRQAAGWRDVPPEMDTHASLVSAGAAATPNIEALVEENPAANLRERGATEIRLQGTSSARLQPTG